MPTTNPVPSQDPSDLLFNAGKLDEVLNGTGTSFTDRLGTARRTVAGMNADFDAQLADAESDLNVYRADAAASAAEALGYLNTIRTTSYGAYAGDPATDPLGNPPNVGDEYFNTTSNLLKRFNGTTWQASDINTANLAAPSGSSIVGYQSSGTGAVATTLNKKSEETVSAFDYMNAFERADVQSGAATLDVTAAIFKAIARAEEIFGTAVFPGGKYLMTYGGDVGCDIEGYGSTIVTPGGSDFKVFEIIDKSYLSIRNLKFKKAGTNLKKSYPISVGGESKDISIQNVFADGYYSAVIASNVEDLARNAVFDVAFTNTAAGGNWKLGFFIPGTLGEPVWTADLAWNISLASMQSAIDAVLGAGNVTVSGGPAPAGIFRLTFGGSYAGLHVQQPMLYASPTGQKEWGGSVDLIAEGGAKWVRNLVLDKVIARNSGIYGFEFNYVDGLQMLSCHGTHSWFDGIKLRAFTRDTFISGGDYSYNGVSWLEPGAGQWAGDGIDSYVGGGNLKIVGAKFNYNNGSGLLLKNDDPAGISGYGSGKLGMVRKIDLIGVEASFNSVANGLSVSINGGANTSYHVTDVTVTGGTYEGNAVYGISVIGSRVTLNSPKCRRNGDTGIGVSAQSRYVELNHCTSVANGRGAGTGYGARIDGKDVTVNGGLYLGVDTDSYSPSTDLSALTKYHLTNIRVGSTAANVRIRWPKEAYNSSGRGIVVADAAGVFPSDVIIWQNPTEAGLVPGSSGIYGSPGSMVLKSDATQAGDRLFIKLKGESGQAGAWRRIGASTIASYSASATMDGGADVILCNTSGVDTVITLPPVSDMVGMEYKFTRTSQLVAQKVYIARNGTDLIDNGTQVISLNAFSSSATLIGTTGGWRVINKSGDVTYGPTT